MKLWVRAVLGVALLAAVPLVMLLMLGGLVVAEAWVLGHHYSTWTLLIAPAGLVLLKGLHTLIREVGTPTAGVPMTERDQPELWDLVRRIAEVAGTRPPDEIYLIADANASVVEDCRFLGLVSTRRRMFVGAPLIAGLLADQLAAILTHELAHYSNRDTRLSGLTYRGRRAFAGTVAALNQDWFQKILASLLAVFLALYLRASAGLSRRQERAADEAAARAVGSGVAASALRELGAIIESWRLFVDNQLVWGWDAGYLPADAFAGYAELRTAHTEELDRIRRNPPERSTPYDTHPPMAERVAAIEAMAAEPVVEVGHRSAASLLLDPDAMLDAALLSGLVPQAREKARVDWNTLANARGLLVTARIAEQVLGAAAKLTGGKPTIGALLEVLDQGRLTELPPTRPDDNLGPRVRRELAHPEVHKGLSAVISIALADAGAASWKPRWPFGVEFTAEPYATELPALLDAALADPPDTTGLRTLLDNAGVPLDQRRNHAVQPQPVQLQGKANQSDPP